jgi:hypothetical protein
LGERREPAPRLRIEFVLFRVCVGTKTILMTNRISMMRGKKSPFITSFAPLTSILNRLNIIHTIGYFFRVYLNSALSSTPRSTNRYLPFMFPKKNSIHFSFLLFAACPTKPYCTLLKETAYYLYLLHKMKLNLCLHLIKQDTMKFDWEAEVYLHAFLTST